MAIPLQSSSSVAEEMATGVLSTDSETDEMSLSFVSSDDHKATLKSSTPALSSDSRTCSQLTKCVSSLASLNSQHWYSDACFARYWKHYKFVRNWYTKHCKVYKSLKKTTSHRSHTINTAYPFNCYQQKLHHTVSRSVAMCNNKKSGGSAQKKQKSEMQMEIETDVGLGESNVIPEDSYESDVPSSLPVHGSYQVDTNISEEMLDFFAKSLKHRKEREAEKKAEKLKAKEEKLINIEDVKCQPRERSSEAPKERPGSRRTAEMKYLYGKGAAMIHGMETALQMTYDRNLDAKQPTYWPNMPFKIHFVSV